MGSPMEPEARCLTHWQGVLSICLSPPVHWGMLGLQSHAVPLFLWVLGIQTWVLMTAERVLVLTEPFTQLL